MSAATLRPAVPADHDAIAAIWHEGWIDGHVGHVPEALHPHRTPAHFRRRVPPRIPRTTVATLGGRVVGFATVHDDELEQLFVAADARGSGVAGATRPPSTTAPRSKAAPSPFPAAGTRRASRRISLT